MKKSKSCLSERRILQDQIVSELRLFLTHLNLVSVEVIQPDVLPITVPDTLPQPGPSSLKPKVAVKDVPKVSLSNKGVLVIQIYAQEAQRQDHDLSVIRQKHVKEELSERSHKLPLCRLTFLTVNEASVVKLKSRVWKCLSANLTESVAHQKVALMTMNSMIRRKRKERGHLIWRLKWRSIRRVKWREIRTAEKSGKTKVTFLPP